MNRAIAPEIKNAVDTEIVLPEIERRDLMTNLPLFIYRGGAQEVFKLQLSIPCGSWIQDKPLQTLMTSALWKQGTKSHTAEQINEQIDFYGASLTVSYSADMLSFSITGLSEHMVDLTKILQEIILEPLFDAKEFENYLQRTKQNFLINREKSDYIANREIERMLFGMQHPYGAYTMLEDFDKIKLEDIREMYKKKISLHDGVYYLSGNFTENDLVEVEMILNDIQLRDKPSEEWNYGPAPEKEEDKIITIKEDAMQAAVVKARLFFDVHHPDFIGMSVLNMILGGYFGSRLMSNIREDKGYTYGIYSSLRAYKHQACLLIKTDVNKDVVDDTFAQIQQEMDRLRNEEVGENELLTVKNYLFSGLMSSVDGPFKIMSRWKGLYQNGFDEKRFLEQQDVFRNITAHDIRTLAQKYYLPEDYKKLTVH